MKSAQAVRLRLAVFLTPFLFLAFARLLFKTSPRICFSWFGHESIYPSAWGGIWLQFLFYVLACSLAGACFFIGPSQSLFGLVSF